MARKETVSETQAAGRSSCSAVSSCPVVPSGRNVLGWVFSAAVSVCHVQIVVTSLGSCWFEPLPELQNGNFSVANGIFFSARVRTVKTFSSPAREALQASCGRVSIVGVQISFSRSQTRPAKLSLQALRFARWTPYGAMDPVAGCRWGSGTS